MEWNCKKIRLEVDNEEYGEVSASDNGGKADDGTIWYSYNAQATLTATAKAGYHFAYWDDYVYENPRTVNVTESKTYTAVFEAHSVITDYAVDATCTSMGLTEGSHCSVCGEVIVEQTEIPMLEHSPYVSSSAVAATCTQYGYTEEISCSVCGNVITTRVEISPLGHTEVTDAAFAATCTESGLSEGSHCSVCGEILVAQQTIPAIGHTEVTDAAVAATCTESGLTEGKHCSACNTVLIAQNTIPATGHTEVVDTAVAATCTESGKTEGSHCSTCGETFVVQTEIPALGHNFANYIYNNDATTEADGTETAVCERGCGANDTRVKEGTKLPKDNTAVNESAVNAINIYAIGSTIVVENATEEIFVYNAMGVLVGRTETTTITVNGAGVYIVKTGGTVKRVMVN